MYFRKIKDCLEGDSVKKVVVKANISYKPNYITPFFYGKIIPSSTVEASFKGSKLNITDIKGIFQYCSGLTSLDLSGWDTSNVTYISDMFNDCTSLTSLDLSGWNMSNVTSMYNMFRGCTSLTSIRMVGCEKPTIDKIKAQLTEDNITGVTIVTE